MNKSKALSNRLQLFGMKRGVLEKKKKENQGNKAKKEVQNRKKRRKKCWHSELMLNIISPGIKLASINFPKGHYDVSKLIEW